MTPAQQPTVPSPARQPTRNEKSQQEFVLEYWQATVAENPRQEWCWRLRTLAGATVAHNEGFPDLGECLRSIRQLRHAMADASVTGLTPRAR